MEDLAVASPATVSRCGMVYMEPNALGIEPLLASWLARLPRCAAPHKELLGRMLRCLLPPCLHLVRKQLKETVATVDHNLAMSCLNLMDALLRPYDRQEGELPDSGASSTRVQHKCRV